MPSSSSYHDHYARCIANGCSEALADMLSARSFPGVKGTDRAFLEGRITAEDDAETAEFRRRAEAAGVSTTGKVYCGGLADRPGDPRAWVSGLDDVRALARERNIGVRGAVEVRRVEGPPPEPVRLAPDLVAEGVARRLEDEPRADPEAVADELARAWSGPSTGG